MSSAERLARDLGPLAAGAPELVREIYTSVLGTPHDVADQTMMDFVPGYRLIHVSELAKDFAVVAKHWASGSTYFPFLADYAGDYVAWRSDGRIVSLMHDDPEVVVFHESSEKLYETICAFYEEGVYHLLDDGYLDSHFVREGEIGAKHNPGVDYWLEERRD